MHQSKFINAPVLKENGEISLLEKNAWIANGNIGSVFVIWVDSKYKDYM